MNQKLNLFFTFIVVLGLTMFTSCGNDDDILIPVVTCDSLFNATITLEADSLLHINAELGVVPYAYEWADGSTGNTLELSGAETYTVTVTDDNNCTAVATFQLTGSSSCDEPIDVSLVPVDPVGATTLLVNFLGGTSPYSYEWSTGATSLTLAVTSSGTYSVTMTDSNGCTGEDSIEITVVDPCANFAIDVIDSLVVNTLMVNINGAGTAPYSYSWSDGSTGSTLTVTATGTYSVTVTDANGCTLEDDFTVTAIADPCEFFSTEIMAVDSFSVIILFAINTGGIAPYSYIWSEGSTTSIAEIAGGSTGTYSVTTTDSNGCTAEDDIDL